MDRKAFSLVPEFQADTYTLDTLEQLTRILRKYCVHEVKFTSSRRLGLAGVDREDLDFISRELQPFSTTRKTGWITTLQACPGQNQCGYGLRDTALLAARIEALELPALPPAKIKIGIAGCRMCCTEPYVRDLGLIAENSGWKLTFGGNGGGRPRLGDTIAEGLTDNQAVELIRNCLTVYLKHAGPRMRTARFMESYGAEKFRQTVLALASQESERN